MQHQGGGALVARSGAIGAHGFHLQKGIKIIRVIHIVGVERLLGL